MNIYRMSREALEDYAAALENQVTTMAAAHEETLNRKHNVLLDWLDLLKENAGLRAKLRDQGGE